MKAFQSDFFKLFIRSVHGGSDFGNNVFYCNVNFWNAVCHDDRNRHCNHRSHPDFWSVYRLCAGDVFDRDGKSDAGGVVFDPVFGAAAGGGKPHLSACGWRVDRTAVHMGACGGDAWRKIFGIARVILFFIPLCSVLYALFRSFVKKRLAERSVPREKWQKPEN